MRVMVVGATGAIGRLAVPIMLRDGHRVTAVSRSADRLRNLASQGASTIELDLFDRDAMRRAMEGHEALVNLATRIPRPGLDLFLPASWKETDRIREHGSTLLAEGAISAGVKVYIQESFAPIYEEAGDRWITEDEQVRPARYNQSTLKAEASANHFARRGGRGVVLRFAYFYGPGDRFTEDVFRYVSRGWLPVLGPPDAYFSTVHHEDAASAVVAALDVPSGIYNVVDNDPLTHRQLGASLAQMLGVREPRTPPQWVTSLTGGLGETMSRSLRIANVKLKNLSHWAPKYATSREGWEAVHRTFAVL